MIELKLGEKIEVRIADKDITIGIEAIAEGILIKNQSMNPAAYIEKGTATGHGSILLNAEGRLHYLNNPTLVGIEFKPIHV
jgi:predicted O-methyltransferase YrrM